LTQSRFNALSVPTLQSRLRRRLILLSSDAALAAQVAQALPPPWELSVRTELAALGGFAEVLQHRFMLIDLDDRAFDPVAAVREVRSTLMLNIPVFCFGGAQEKRDAARLARADRFFEHDEIETMLPQFCEQFGW